MIDYRFITYPYLKNFKCSADKCVSTCCYGWNVKVDDKTLEAYKSLCNSFGDYLVDHISQNSKHIYMNKNYCPFLDSEKMCKIQKEYGHNMLCEVCKTYPRAERYLINIQQKYLVLSCPEVINLIKKANIFDKETEIVKIKGKETKQETLTLKFYDYFFEKLKYIYNKKANLYKTMYVLLTFAYNADKYFKQKYTEKSIEEFNNKFNKKYFDSLYKEYKTKKDYDFIKSSQLSVVKNNYDLKVANKNINNLFKFYLNFDFNNLNFKKSYKQAQKSLNKNLNLYNILFYVLNIETFNIIKDKEFVSYLNASFVYITLIQSLFYSSYLSDSLRAKNNSLIVASNLYRFIYHSYNIDLIMSKYDNGNFCNKENLFKYLTSF